jgi:hypothetical protein
MDEHGLRPAGRGCVPVSRAERDRLVLAQNEARHLRASTAIARERLDDGRVVGPEVGKDAVDAMLAQ